MSIIFKSNVVFKSTKIYSFDHKNKKLVDKIFDKLHEQDKMRYITQSTSFNYSIFVIWRDIMKKRKNRTIINIHDFNDITIVDNYSFSLQNDIIFFVTDYFYIFFVNVVDWFHQFNVRRIDRSKFTMINVTVPALEGPGPSQHVTSPTGPAGPVAH